MMNNTNSLSTQLDEDIVCALIEHMVTNLPTEILGQEVHLFEDGAIESVAINRPSGDNATAFHFKVGTRVVRVAIQPLLRSRVRATLER